MKFPPLGKPIVPIVFFHMKRNDHLLNYIIMEESMRDGGDQALN